MLPERLWAEKAKGQRPCFGKTPHQRVEGGRAKMQRLNNESKKRLDENQSVKDQRS